MVLVDSSVWIEFFRVGGRKKLDMLIEEDLVCTNDIILLELLPYLRSMSEKEVIEGLLALKKIELSIDWEILRRYQSLNIQNGINRVGIPDLIILQQTIFSDLTLYTYDKHFKLMAQLFDFKLFAE